MEFIKGCKSTDPELKVDELIKEFSIEKSIDICESMLWYAKEFQEDVWTDFWTEVISQLKKK